MHRRLDRTEETLGGRHTRSSNREVAMKRTETPRRIWYLGAYWRFADELDRSEARMIYKDARAHNYYKNSYGRPAVNGPIDIRRIWRWLRVPSGSATHETDAGIRLYFDEDLLVR